MNLPIRFPSDVDVNTEELARIRALSAEDRVRTLGELGLSDRGRLFRAEFNQNSFHMEAVRLCSWFLRAAFETKNKV